LGVGGVVYMSRGVVVPVPTCRGYSWDWRRT